MLKKKSVISLVLAIYLIVMTVPVFASSIKPTILFVPHDDRPVSFRQTANTLSKMKYNLYVPPQELLGNRDNLGKPDELWDWLFANAKKADAVVLSSDSLLYGSLVASRKHNEKEEVILKRTDNFSRLKQQNPNLKIYVFGSIMRTPRSGEAAGSEEPSYYAKYGTDIFKFTALTDKSETLGLTRKEGRDLKKLEKSLPKAAINDWMSRRNKNFNANKQMIGLARAGDFNYLVLGRDDNAPFSQTNKESRLLDKESLDLGISKFQTLSGIDEMGMVLLARAVNDLEWNVPLVSVQYADGVGEKTIPSYANEEIGKAIHAHLVAAGAIPAFSDKRADFVLVVNTNKNGETYEANFPNNTIEPRENTKSVVDTIEKYLDKGKQVAIADISFANGADNALMYELNKRGMLPKVLAYSGWNTANNSAGYAIGQGVLAKNMSQEDKNYLLSIRFLDDWAYQANIRQAVAGEAKTLKGGSYSKLDKAKSKVIRSTQEKMNQFSKENLKQFSIEEVRVDFPWNRMFEVDVNIKENKE